MRASEHGGCFEFEPGVFCGYGGALLTVGWRFRQSDIERMVEEYDRLFFVSNARHRTTYARCNAQSENESKDRHTHTHRERERERETGGGGCALHISLIESALVAVVRVARLPLRRAP